MGTDVIWLLETTVDPKRSDEFHALMEEMVRATKDNEPGTLAYEWSVSEDGTRCHLYEHYADSAAAMTHIDTFGERFADRFMDLLTPTRLVLYGAPSPEVKRALAPMNPELMPPVGGFTRQE